MQNILTRLRRPGETFDATMLLVAEVERQYPAGTLRPIDQPDPQLGAGVSFANLIKATTERTPVAEHGDLDDPSGDVP